MVAAARRLERSFSDCPLGSGGWAGPPSTSEPIWGLGEAPRGSGRGGTPCPELGGH